jgi:hypothetical protein
LPRVPGVKDALVADDQQAGDGDHEGRQSHEAAPDLPRAFRTADLRLIHAAICCSRYSLWTCCGVRY